MKHGKKWLLKRCLPILLAIMMAVTSVPTEYAYAAEIETEEHTHEHTEESENIETNESESESSEAIQQIQTMIDEILDYYLVYYGFEIPDMEYKAEEDMTEEERQAWEDIYAQIEDIVVNKMDDGERGNALMSVKEVEYAIEEYALTEDEQKVLLIDNPVFFMFGELVYQYGTSVQVLATDATSKVGVTGLSVSYDTNAAWVLAGTQGKASCTPGAGSVSAEASSSKGYISSHGTSTVTITLTNSGYDNALLTFTYAAPASGGTGTITTTGIATGSGSGQSFTLSKGKSVTVKLTSSSKNTNSYNLSLTNIQLVEVKMSTVTFEVPTNGSYTVDGTNIATNTTFTNENTKTYSLVATPVSGASFVAWTDENGLVLSMDAKASLAITEDAIVKAVFAKNGGAPVFGVGSISNGKVNVTHLYDNWDGAMNAGLAGVVLLNNAILPARESNYEIPSGVTLLLPYDASNTLSTTKPNVTLNTTNYGLIGDKQDIKQTVPYPNRTIEVADGAHIIVKGAINVNAKMYAGGTGSVVGGVDGAYGHIKMNTGSSITVNSGANLYCWGYITGAGSVIVESNGTVYENFQVMDWRGGSCIADMIDNEQRVFPMSQYYVQNIEVPMTLKAGAIETGYTASTVTLVGEAGTSVPFIGSSGMFNITDGYIIKDYDEATDRLEIEIYGSMRMQTLKISMNLGTAGTQTLNSSNYVLAINGNIGVHVHRGDLMVTQDIGLLPGAKIVIEEGTNCTLDKNVNFFLIDQAQWTDSTGSNPAWDVGLNGYVGTLPGHNLQPLNFAPGRTNPTESVRSVYADGTKLPDAEIVINGTVDVSKGSIWTTGTVTLDAEGNVIATGGANVRSEGNGKIILAEEKGAVAFYQCIPYGGDKDGKSAKYFQIAVTSALLKNNDGTFVMSNQDINPSYGSTFTYEEGSWVLKCNMNGTASGCEKVLKDASKPFSCSNPYICQYCKTELETSDHTPGAAATCTTDQTCTVCGAVVAERLNHKNGSNVFNAVTPKCYDTEAGHLAYYACKDCGAYFEDNSCTKPIADLSTWLSEGGAGYAPIPEHTWNQGNVKTPADCTTEGVMVYACTVCSGAGKTTTKEGPIPALGHQNVTTTPQVDATCTTAGIKAYYFCNVCDTYYSDADYTTEITDLAAWKSGAGMIPATGHSTTKTDEVDSTCAEFGTKAYWYCANCKLYYSDEDCTKVIGDETDLAAWKNGDGQIVKKAHQMTDVQQVDATCLAAGAKPGTRCSVCGAIESGCETIPQLSHKAALPLSQAPDCDDDGYKTHYLCTNGCKLYYEDEACTIVIGDAAAMNAWKVEGGKGYLPALGHTEVEIPAVPATCTTAGTTAGMECSVCHVVITAPENIPASHTPGEGVVENLDPATGIHELVVYCSVCENEISRKTIIPGQSAEHTLSMLDRVEPTCTTTGLSAGAICEVGLEGGCPACVADGKTYTMEQEVLEMLPHTVNPSAITLEWNGYAGCTATATCVNAGCNATVTETVEATETGRVEATCNAAGSVTYTTSAFTNEAFINAGLTAQTATKQLSQLTHQWGEVAYRWSDNNTTCTATRECIHGCIDTEEITGITGVVTAPTCTEAGYATYKATFNYAWHEQEDKIQTIEIPGDPAKGHTWNVTATAWNNDNTQCTVNLHCDCGAADSAVSASVSKSETPATCTAPGSVVYTAVFADEYKIAAQDKTVTIAAQGHDWTGAIVTYTWAVDYSSCTASRSCQQGCGHSETETVNATLTGSTATCIAAGKNTYQSGAFTNMAFAQQTTQADQAALGHDMTYVEAKDATCTEDGNYAHYTCKRCGNAYKDEAGSQSTTLNAETIYSSGHDYTAVVTAPTCNSKGYTTHTCSKCNDVKVDTYVDPRYEKEYHSYNEGIVTTDPTCIDEGIKTFTCSECNEKTENHSYTVVVAALGHTSVVDEAVAATCTTTGLTVGSHCSVCDDVLVAQEVTPVLGHDYKAEVTAPTFDAQGYTTHTCSRCNDTYVDSYVDALIAVAKIGDQRYETLAEAITKAVSGDTIILLIGGEYDAPVIVNEGVTLDLNGQTIKGNLIGTLLMNGGTWITPENYEMVGPNADYYQTTDAKIIMGMPNAVTGQADITLVSGTLTLVPDEWWTLPGQILTIGEGASFVIPEGKTLQVLSKVVVEGSATVDGNVNLYTADAVVTAVAEGLNITTTAGDCVLYVNGMYIVHTHTPADAVVENNEDPTCTETGSYDAVIYCSNQNCKAELDRKEVIVDELGHTKATDAAVAATCTETGLTEGSHCSVCGDVLVAQEVTPVLGHKDENKDHVCENGCGIYQGEHTDTDTDEDHLCDYGCQKQIGDHVYTDGVCNCGYVQDLKVSLVITAENALDQNVPQADIKYGTDYSVTLNFSEFGTCYILQSVVLTVGGEELSTEEYTYNSVTKELHIDKAYVTGDIEITVIAEQRHEIGESKWEYKAPTCEETGEMGYTIYCAKCNNVYHKQTTEIAATGHSYYSIYTEPTFTADGYYTYTCATCKASYTEIAEGTKLTAVAQIGTKQYESLEEAIEAAKNGDVIILLTKVTVDGTAQWDLNGITLRIHDNANANYGLVVSGDLTINGGNFVATGIYGIGVQPNAKLTINGGTFSVNDNDYLIGSWGTTVINGGTFKGQYSCVNAFDGSMTITGGVFTTEDKDWSGTYDSSDVFGEAVSITGGTFSKTVEEYLAEGYCQKIENDKYIVKAHIGGEIVIENTVAASCMIDGSHDEVTYCTHCGEVATRQTVMDTAPGHTVVIDEAVAATCTTTGLTEGKHCSVCSEVLVAQNGVAALGHTYDDGVVTTDPTCTEAGVKTYTCTVCAEGIEGHTKTESVDPINHAWSVIYDWSEDYKTCTATHVCGNDAAHNETETVEVVALQTKDPTCTAKGETTYTATFTALWAELQMEILEDVDALDHAWSVTYDWSVDYKTCIATHVCGNDPTHNETETVTVGSEQTKAPTCTAKGETTYTATFTALWAEQQVETIDDVPANGHNMREVKGTEATCVTVGNNTYYVCGRCSGVFKDVDGQTATTAAAEIIPAKGHSYDHVVTDSTCIAQGYTTHTCTVCAEGTVGHSYVDSYVDALGHSYDDGVVTTDPTCTATGIKTYTCSVCTAGTEGHIKTESVKALGHTEVTDAYQAPTCTETGLTAGTHCSKCGEVLEAQQVIDAKGHTTVVDAAVAPTCTATGLTEGSHCSACNEVFTEQQVVDAKGHTDGEVKIENVVAPQCEVDGSHDEVTYCTVCTAETSRVAVVDAKTGHTEKTLSAKEADCINTGLTEGKQCTVCNKFTVPQDVVAAKGHTKVVDQAVEATCTATGLTEGEHCSVCDVVLKAQTVVPMKSHSHNVLVSSILPTCTVDGEQVLKCENCDDTIKETQKASGHNSDGTLAAVAPTCTATGLTEGKKCSVCGTITVEQQIVPATGHNTIATIKQVDPTCTIDGVKEHYFCDDCDKYFATKTVEGEVVVLSDEITNMAAWKLGDGKIDKLGHTNEIIPAVAPTCTEDGLKSGIKCPVCGEITVPQVVDPAKGHNKVTDKAVDPTCTATGLTEGSHCSVCTEVLVAQEVIDALGHTEDTIPAAAATCTETGLTEGKKCSVCGEITVPQIKVNALGHTEETLPFVASSCTETGLTAGKYCTVCETITVPQDIIPVKGHTEVIDGKVDPTCTATGLTEGKHCSECGEVLLAQETVDAKGHTPNLVTGMPAKCEQAGWKDYYQCKDCELYFVDEECTEAIADLEDWKVNGAGKIDELGHSWDDGRITTLPECEVDGVKTFTCGTCNGTKTAVEPMLGHAVVSHEGKKPTYSAPGWYPYETCERCDYNSMVAIPALGEAEITAFEEFIENLAILEQIADTYVKKVAPGNDPAMLIIKYIRTGVDRYNSGSWNIMAGYEDADFASYVRKYEEEYNNAREDGAEMMKVTGLKNIHEFYLPNGDWADIGHVFGSMDITYTNKTSEDHADVSGWAGDTIDLMSMVDQFGWESATLEGMIEEINEKYFLKYREDFEEEPIEGTFSNTDMEGDLDAFYVMQQLYSQEYKNGTLTDIFTSYMTASLTSEQRAKYFLDNRLDGVSLRSDVRDAIYNEVLSNDVVMTLEATREFNTQDLTTLRKACCYVVADYLCRLAGDFVEVQENEYFNVFQSETTTLAPGIVQKINYANTADGKTMVYYLATGDIGRGDVHVYANYHNNDPSEGWEMQRVIDQANVAQNKYGDPESEHYIENYNVIASINGAGYDMYTGEPSGILVMNGEVYHPIDTHGFFGILDDGTAMIGTMAQYNELQADGRVKEAIATFGDLIRDGKIIADNSSDRASRTAVGITATGKVVFMVLDGRQGDLSCGGNMREIAQIMLEAGCVVAVNLDGGGSSTYVAREPGAEELSVVSKPSDGISRSVSTSLLMVSTAPSSTAFDHAVVDGEYSYFTVGASGAFTAKAVSATGNQVEMPEGVEWAVSDPAIGTIDQDGVFTALNKGTVEIQMMLDGDEIGSKTVYVVDPDNVYFEKAAINAIYGEPVTLPVKAVYEGKAVAITEADAVLSLADANLGTIDGFTFVGNEASGVRKVVVTAALVCNPSITGTINISMYTKDEASFDFENATGGDAQLSWNREVDNATDEGNNSYRVIDSEQDMVTHYTFAMDMSKITMPVQLEDLIYMLPGADVEGNNSAWSFLLQLAERISTLTEVTPVLYFDKNLDVDYSELSINNEYFYLKEAIFNEEENSLTLVMKWHRQDKPIDADTANPLCIVTGITLTPKEDAAWNSNDALSVINRGSIGYDIYLRANALYSFSGKPENQEIYGLYPFTNVREDGVQENGGHFQSVYKEFEDQYILQQGIKDGWVVEGGGFAYYENGEKYIGVCEVDGYYYDFGENGVNIGQKKYTGEFTDEKSNEYYAVDGLNYYGWMIMDMKNVRYYNPETGIREKLYEDETPSTCIIDGHCIYTTESGEVKRIDYDDAGGHDYVEQADGSNVCELCGYVRIEMPEVNVTLSYYVTTYTGDTRTPTTTAVAKNGYVLTKPGQTDYPDYSSTYENNVEVGTASVTLKAVKYGKYSNLNTWRGNAAGQITVTYEIRPDLPTNPKMSMVDGKAVMTWTAAKTPDVIYVLYKSMDGENWTEFATTVDTTYAVDLSEHAGCQFKIGTRKEVDGKIYESINKSSTLYLAAQIVEVGHRVEDGKPTLRWLSVRGANKYYVWRSNSENGKYSKVFETGGLTYTHTSSELDQTYYYYVVAAYVDANSEKIDFLPSEIVSNTAVCGQPVVIGGNDAEGNPILSWNAVTNATKYVVYRADSEGGEFVKIATQTGLNFVDTNTEAGKAYYYMVAGVTPKGNEGVMSDIISVENKKVESTETLVVNGYIREDNGKPRVTWTAVEGAEKYVVYRSEDGVTFVKMYTTTGLSYTNTGAVTDHTYYYEVRVVINGVETVTSDVVKLTAIAVGFVASGYIREDNGKPRITWTKVLGADQYVVYRSEDGVNWTKMYTTKGLSYTNTSAKEGVNYYYQVKAYSGDSEQDVSNMVSFMSELMSPVASGYIREDNGKPRITWNAVVGADSYEVYRSEDGVNWTKMYTTKGLSYTNSSAKAGTTYSYKVKALTANAESAFSNVVNFTATIVAPKLTGFVLETNGKPRMTWQAVSGATQYEVWRSEDGVNFIKMFTTNGLSYTNTSAMSGKTYYYKAKAFSGDVASPFSDVISITSER